MPVPTPNPYRQILSRRFPEPFIALLAFLLGVWLWDHYFGVKEGYEPGTDQIALVKMDRDVRLAEAMSGDPHWLRALVGVGSPEKARRRGIDALWLLANEKSLGSEGLGALVVAESEQDHKPVLETLRQTGAALQGVEFPESYETVIGRMLAGEGRWWDRSLARAYIAERPISGEMAVALKMFDDGSATLRKRAIIGRCAVWLVVVAGTFCIPLTLRRLAALRHWKDRGYISGWSASLGMVVFLAATLAWIGFSLSMRAGFTAVQDVPEWLVLALDTAMRLLPALIAIGLLFRRPGHAIRVFGLNRAPSWGIVLGAFALVGWINELVLPPLKHYSPPDPTGGLGFGEDGMWGLTVALVSACLMAPIAEEIVYRGVLFRSLGNRFGILAGALLSAGAFALVHFYDLYGLASVGAFGFTCALVYAATRNLPTAIVLHLLYNAAVKVPEWLVYHSSLH
ncbi:type II CAAX endopeptidase family protein [Luteolibacter sp. LG18]|uniref:CPBP family intramembrane glutamic endopeptidase n=1 Tax=Luteolibacter sp. LG18 TaxID=2819286 RepID=UPI0030C661D4